MPPIALILTLFLLPVLFLGDIFSNATDAGISDGGNTGRVISGHTNNWAVLVCSSRYWFNYRVSASIQGKHFKN